jgi:hypothetical protein
LIHVGKNVVVQSGVTRMELFSISGKKIGEIQRGNANGNQTFRLPASAHSVVILRMKRDR